jgi:ABC-type polysaccharide/polyol phosphate export permease
VNALKEVRDSRELLLNLTSREIRGKYKRTVLGQAWSLLNPLAQMAIFSIVFGFVLRSNPPPGDPSGLDVFALWLTSALLPWLFFANVVSGGMGSIVGNSNLVLKVYFPRHALVISNTLSLLFTFAIEITVLMVVVTLFGGMPWPFLPAVVIAMLLLAAFGLGIAFMLAVANVYFRDTQHFVAILLQVWFYSTPILYPISLIQARDAAHPDWHIMTLYRLNPLERFAEVFRALIYDNKLPTFASTAYVVVVSLGVLAMGFAVFRHFEGRLAEEL